MEKFAVDLDAVLDELEQFEVVGPGASPSVGASRNSGNPSGVSGNPSSSNNPLNITNSSLYRESPILSAYSSSSRSIDSREADFGIQARPPKLLAFDNPNYSNNSSSSSLLKDPSFHSSSSATVQSDKNASEDHQEDKKATEGKETFEDSSLQPSFSSSSSSSSPTKSSSSSAEISSPTTSSSSQSAMKTTPEEEEEDGEGDSDRLEGPKSPQKPAVLLPDLLESFAQSSTQSSSNLPKILPEIARSSGADIPDFPPEIPCDNKAILCDIVQHSLPSTSGLEGSMAPTRSNVQSLKNPQNPQNILQNPQNPQLPVGFGRDKVGSSESSGYGDEDDEEEEKEIPDSGDKNPQDKVDDKDTKDSLEDSVKDSADSEPTMSHYPDLVTMKGESSSKAIDELTEGEIDRFLSELNDDDDDKEIKEEEKRIQSDKDSQDKDNEDKEEEEEDNKQEVIDQDINVVQSTDKDTKDSSVDTANNIEIMSAEEEVINNHDGAVCGQQVKVIAAEPCEEESGGESMLKDSQEDPDEGLLVDLQVPAVEQEEVEKEPQESFQESQESQESTKESTKESQESAKLSPPIDLSSHTVGEPVIEQVSEQGDCLPVNDNDEVFDPELEELKNLEEELRHEEELERAIKLSLEESRIEQLIPVQNPQESGPESVQNPPESGQESVENPPESVGDNDVSSPAVPEASSSSLNPQEDPSTVPSNPSGPQDSRPQARAQEDRGGLVQNVRIFERQEMPNGLMEHEQMLGKIKPFWVPDEEAQNCLHCDVKFTLIKRRHHCRSCGKVLCSQCCNYKAKLMYLESKEARVCRLCFEILMRIEAIERRNGRPLEIHRENSSQQPEVSSTTSSTSGGAGTPGPIIAFPDPNNPSEYCSTLSPFDQMPNAPTPPTVMVPVGVLKRRNTEPGNGAGSDVPSVPKQVIFSDGVRPGGDLIEHGASSSRLPESSKSRPQLHLKIPSKPSMEGLILKRKGKPHKVVINDRNGQVMPPIVNYHELRAIDPNLEFLENYEQLVEFLKADWLPSITFNLAKNLFLNAKLVLKDCCKRGWCWSFASRGLASVGQDEILFVLDCDSFKPETPGSSGTATTTTAVASGSGDDKEVGSTSGGDGKARDFDFPRDVFKLFLKIYDSASNACPFSEMSHLFFPDGLFGKKENAGFVFVLPTMQCFRNLLLPSPPALIALLIHKWEIPWVRIFPLRLVLRLGHEYNSYPTPVISDASRKSVYYEIGHTIMNVLADFRNFSYTLFTVKDLLIHTEQRKRVKMIIPKASYEQVCKVLSTSNDHVLAFGANFSGKADSHFVCMQHELDLQGEYQTAVSTLPDLAEPGVTAASFIVFSGALKSTTGLKAKMSVVEDGLLVQIPAQTMEEMRTAIREMKEFKILCCKIGETVSDEWVEIAWVNDELSTNLGVRSQIDGTNLEGVQSARIFSSPDYTNERFLIRWIEIFILQINENTRRSEMVNTSRLAESVAQAFCVSMVEYLDQLFEAGFTKIGLRISLDVDRVGYESGSNGATLPEVFTANLDGALIPAIMDNVSTTGIESAHVIELVFHILYK